MKIKIIRLAVKRLELLFIRDMVNIDVNATRGCSKLYLRGRLKIVLKKCRNLT